jgi:hypothetical protein
MTVAQSEAWRRPRQEGGGRDRRRDDVGDGHPHHRGGQKPLRLLERLHVPARDARALLGEVAEPHPVGGQERDLGAREEGRGEEAQQHEAEGDAESHAPLPDRTSASGSAVPFVAAGRASGAAGRRTSTWRTRFLCMVSTVTRMPSASTVSPPVGHAAEQVEHPAPDRVEVLVRDGQPRDRVVIADRHLRRHAPDALVHGLGEPLLGLELVADLADDLLQEVLEGDQPRRSRRTRPRRSPSGAS